MARLVEFLWFGCRFCLLSPSEQTRKPQCFYSENQLLSTFWADSNLRDFSLKPACRSFTLDYFSFNFTGARNVNL